MNATRVGLCAALVSCVGASVSALDMMKEVITYGCRATATGTVYAWASIDSLPLIAFDDDTGDLSGHFAPLDQYTLIFSNGAGVSAGVAETFFDCCWTDASASAKGDTNYSFSGDTITMDFKAWSYREHKNRIDRNTLGVCEGNLVETESGYEVPQTDALDVRVPFKITDYGIDVPVEVDFLLKRGDSGPTSGATVGVWRLFRDNNCNCVLDEGDELIAWDKWIIFPNESYEMPTQNFEVKPGCFIMEYTYFSWSVLNVDSEDCSESVKASSEVEDKMEVFLRVFP